MQEANTGSRVAIIMGSKSDLATMEWATKPLSELGVEFEIKVVSAPTSAVSMSLLPERAAQRTWPAWRRQ